MLMLAACSTKKNTAGSRFWHSFTARYNTYYNGHEAYKEGCLAKEKGHRDNFTEQIPLFTVASEKSRSTGSGNFDKTIEKCEKAIHLHSIKRRPVVSNSKKRTPELKAYLNRKEFNPFLKNAWLLMGKAQFQKGEFLEAASTFSYISRLYATEPLVATEARVWLARCYTLLDWYYDAEDALNKVNRDTITSRIAIERDATMADLLLRQNRYAEALPYLENVAKKEKRKQQKARLYFLLGQIQQENGNTEAAYQAFKKAIAQNPTYELAFNARIRQTEVLSGKGQSKKMISRLKKMARSANNKDYLDQVYYALGNIHMAQKDTAAAIDAYETGRKKSARNGIEKGVLVLRLAGIYWDMGKYEHSQKCYTEAIGLINKEYEGYDEIARRSKVLDELVPFTSSIHLQDSLLALSTMSESERNAAIDRVIEELKRKEEEERRSKEDSAAEARGADSDRGGNRGQNQNNRNNVNTNDKGGWYFYNQMLVIQGKQEFEKVWGKRKNEDNWRRSNLTVIAMEDEEGYDYEAEDSIAEAEALNDSIEQAQANPEDSIANDPHHREYYLKQIPFTEEAKVSCHEIIKEALYSAAVIEKDKLEDFPLAEKTFKRLRTDYPDYEKMEDVYYQMFLLYSRWGKTQQAEECKSLLAEHFPESAITRIITDPDFERNARHGKEIEDSLYTATYEAYRNQQNEVVAKNFAYSTEKFPKGLNRPKFILVHALSRIGTDDSKTIAADLRKLVETYPKSDVSELAGFIVKGLESGREMGSGHYDIGSLWDRRSSESAKTMQESGKALEFTAERITPFVCLIAYPTDSIDDDQLLYDLAHFNFTGFMARNFDILIEKDAEITQFRISGFQTFDEVHNYAQRMFSNEKLAEKLRHTRLFLVSAKNLELIGSAFSFEDYQQFYDKMFAPIEINPALPLDQDIIPVEQIYEDELPEPSTDEEGEDSEEDGETYEDNSETYEEEEWYSE